MKGTSPKILFAAINARYSHSNPAVRSIVRFIQARQSNCNVCFSEWTISNPLLEIIRGIVEDKPAMVIFSTYIWNSTLAYQAASELRKILPALLIGMGGPEVSYSAEKVLEKNSAVDFIVKGEGEITCAEIALLFETSPKRSEFLSELYKMRGVYSRNLNNVDSNNSIIFGGERELLQNMDELAFIYSDDGTANGNLTEDFSPQNQFAYYETSRGCPFKCTYCLSSLDEAVRYLSMERIFAEIDFFLTHNFRTIKFTDRTFNLDAKRYLAIWRHIAKNHNGITAFHFEIEALHLCDEAFDVLATLPHGAVQFEIGLQSTNPQTLQEICRPTNLQKTAENIRRIPPQVHVHLDLIAGLPHEDFNTFKESFAFAAELKPQMLQLGFLKVLNGTRMEQTVQDPVNDAPRQYAYLSVPPYEVLQTPVLSYSEILQLKDIEHLVDIFYNSNSFMYTLAGLDISLFDFLEGFACFLQANNSLHIPRTVQGNFSVLFDFITQVNSQYFSADAQTQLVDLLRFDFMLLGKTSNFPTWFKRNYSKEDHEKALYRKDASDYFDTAEHPTAARVKYSRSDYEVFAFNPLHIIDTAANSSCTKDNKKETRFLFLYADRTQSSKANYSTTQRTKIIVLE